VATAAIPAWRYRDGGRHRGYAPGLAVAISPNLLSVADPRLDRALFTLRESATYLGVPVSTLHT
jgi:hypothetical protein